MDKAIMEVCDGLALKIFKRTLTESLEKGICIKCGEPAIPKCYSDQGKKEYGISGLCEKCYDEIMGWDGKEDEE